MSDSKANIDLRNAGQAMSGQKRNLENILALIAAAEAVGNVEQAVADANTRRDRALRDTEDAKRLLADAQGQLEAAKKAIAFAEDKAKEIVAGAEKRAGEIRMAAKTEAGKLVGDGAARKTALAAEIAEKTRALEAVEARIMKKSAEAVELEQKIEHTRQQALKAFSG